MNRKNIINQTAEYVKAKLTGEGSGHDWWHVYRVWKNAIYIGKQEKVDFFVVELAALLHDIDDWKFHNGNEDIGPQKAREYLESLEVDNNVITQVCDIIKQTYQDIDFKDNKIKDSLKTLESRVVWDADKLDAIGAIGIARTFAYGGAKGREMYNPDIKPEKHESFEQYKNNQGTSVNHFYEKILLLKELMNTKTAKKIAKRRHKIIEEYLAHFFQEWKGKG